MPRLLVAALLLAALAAPARAQSPTRMRFATSGAITADDSARVERALRAGLDSAGLQLLPPADAAPGGPGARYLVSAQAMGVGQGVLLSTRLIDVASQRVVAQGMTHGAGPALADSAAALGRRLGMAAAR